MPSRLTKAHLSVQDLHGSNETLLYQNLANMYSKECTVSFWMKKELLSSKFQLMYTWGPEQGLPCCSTRVTMIQSVLYAIAKDAEIMKLILESAHNSALPLHQAQQGSQDLHGVQTDAVSIDEHRERYGSMPSMRLVHGTFLLINLQIDLCSLKTIDLCVVAWQ